MENLDQSNQKPQKPTNPTTSPILPLSNLSEKINQTTTEFSEALDDKKPKKRGRPRVNQEDKIQKLESEQINRSKQYEKMVGSFFDLMGNYLSTATGHEGFKLKPDEKQVLAEQGAEVMIEFAPMMNSKYVKLGLFTTTMVSIYGVKVYSYQNELMEQMRLEQNKEVQ